MYVTPVGHQNTKHNVWILSAPNHISDSYWKEEV